MKSEQNKKMDNRMMEMCSRMSKEECHSMMRTMMPMIVTQMDSTQKDDFLDMVLTSILSDTSNDEKLIMYSKLVTHLVNNIPEHAVISYTKQLLDNDERLKEVASEIIS